MTMGQRMLMAVVVAFIVGFGMGVDKGQDMERNHVESVVVSSIMEGREFMFLNGNPVVVTRTVRQGRGVRYRAMVSSEKAGDEYVVPD